MTPQERKAAKDDIKERLHVFRTLPEMQQRRYEDLFADELVGAVLKVTEHEDRHVR